MVINKTGRSECRRVTDSQKWAVFKKVYVPLNDVHFESFIFRTRQSTKLAQKTVFYCLWPSTSVLMTNFFGSRPFAFWRTVNFRVIVNFSATVHFCVTIHIFSRPSTFKTSKNSFDCPYLTFSSQIFQFNFPSWYYIL